MKVLAIDCENSYGPLQPWHEGFYLTNVSLVTNSSKECIWFNHSTKDATPNGMEAIQRAVDQADVIVAHNLKHDLNILRYYGVDFEGKKLYCTMVADYLITGQDTRTYNYNLGDVCIRYGLEGKLDEVKDYWLKGVDTYDIPADVLETYVHDDATKAFELFHLQEPHIKHWGLERCVALQNEFIFSLSDMEINGFVFDGEKATRLANDFREVLSSMEKRIREVVKEPRLSISSNQQLAAALYGGECKVEWREWVVEELKTKPYSYYKNKKFSEVVKLKGLGFNPPKGSKTKTGWSVKGEVIERLGCRTKIQREVKRLLLERTNVAKALSTIIGKHGDKGLMTKVQSDGKIHPTFNNARTVSGRLSSSDPNGQNMPRGSTSPLKTCILPTCDGIAQWDLSQIEWRGAAVLSKDEQMLFEINGDIDQHAAAVKDIMEMRFISKKDAESKQNRQNAKTVNFRMIYRGNAYGFYMDENMPRFPKKKWERICQKFYEKYFGLANWWDYEFGQVELKGHMQLPTGRWFKFHKDKYSKKDKCMNYGESKVANYPVQGIAGGDILPLLCVIIRRAMKQHGLRSKLMLTVHDSIVFDYYEEELEKITKICAYITMDLHKYIEEYYGFKWLCKLDGEMEVGPNYGDLKLYAITNYDRRKEF